MNKVYISLNQKIGKMDSLCFGNFVENLYSCMYGGVYDPKSPVADEDGFRKDVISIARNGNFKCTVSGRWIYPLLSLERWNRPKEKKTCHPIYRIRS